MGHPFKPGTRIHEIFAILSDMAWHCGKCELPGTQPAKAIQIIRQNGYSIENGNRDCANCSYRTVHRRLKSLEPEVNSVVRTVLPNKLRQRIKKLYGNREAALNREMESGLLEIDHRFPQVRWSNPEYENDPNMPDRDARQKFQLLTRANNLWKSRYCEHCAKTGERGSFVGIRFFYHGGVTCPH